MDVDERRSAGSFGQGLAHTVDDDDDDDDDFMR